MNPKYKFSNIKRKLLKILDICNKILWINWFETVKIYFEIYYFHQAHRIFLQLQKQKLQCLLMWHSHWKFQIIRSIKNFQMSYNFSDENCLKFWTAKSRRFQVYNGNCVVFPAKVTAWYQNNGYWRIPKNWVLATKRLRKNQRK